MTSVILEIRDGVATGPIHHPVHKKPVNGQGGFLFSNFDTPPLSWEALCGAEGYVYQRGPLAELGHTVECFHCLVILHGGGPQKPSKGGPTSPETRRRIHERHRGVCEDCGGATSWPGGRKLVRRCLSCHRAAISSKCGTRACYVHGCRCEACRAAARQYQRDLRARKAAA